MPADPYTEIREALKVDSYASPPRHTKVGQDALAALARLEREAAERETALEAAKSELWQARGNAESQAVRLREEDTANESLRARVREVEAERDEARGRAARTDTDLRRTLIRAYRAEATIARQEAVLREIADAGWVAPDDLSEKARAVLARPEAPAAEPPKCPTCRGDGWYADHEDECYERGDCNCSGVQVECDTCHGSGAAALPAVDAPPEPTT